MEKIFDVIGCEDAFKTRLAVYKFEAAAGAEEEQVANAARNYEILHERDDDDAERPDKRPGVPLRATPTRFTLRVDADTRRVSSSGWYLLQVWSSWPSAEGLQEEHHCEYIW
nr:hypothetical protein [Tanacetum cinerariifolium]